MNPATGLLLVGYHALALSALVLPIHLTHVVAGACVYLAVGLGTTVGLHRKLSHRAFDCPKWLEYALVTAALLTAQSSPLEWAANHRMHHGNADGEGDPHSPVFGFWYSHLGWVVDDLSTDRAAWQTVCRDLADDRYYRWLLRFRLVPHFVVLAGIVAVAGWAAAPMILYLPCKAWMHTSYMVNSICHTPRFGTRPHETPDRSRNVWFVGLLGLGEGWHNNHHSNPRSVWFGQRWWQLDVGALFIASLTRLGLARRPSRAA
jgi:stearoyl-CoA desaturase (delta-9 desaturase)